MHGVEVEERSDWPKCKREGCIGIRLPNQERCLAHVDEPARRGWLANLRPGANIDLRGTPIDSALMAALRAALSDTVDERRTFKLGTAYLQQAQFAGDAAFGWAQFNGEARFDRAQFKGDTRFDATEFKGEARFDRAQFRGDTGFLEAKFAQVAGFSGAEFSQDVRFMATEFEGDARFNGAQFSKDADFTLAHFSQYAGFTGTQFNGRAICQGAQFRGNAGFFFTQFKTDTAFEGAQFYGDALFRGALFSATRELGALLAVGELSLSEASFSAPILIEAAAARLSVVGAIFEETASLRLRFAEILLDGSRFEKPSTISFAKTSFQSRSGYRITEKALETTNRPQCPRLISLRRIDVSNVVLGNLDLSACLFQETHNLEELRIEGPLCFAATPPHAWRVRVGPWGIPIWRWMGRQTLAEEHNFRAQPSPEGTGNIVSRLRRQDWNPPVIRTLDWVEKETGQQVQTLAPDQIAALYRALRNGLEDQKNAPAAADFYYGEMEMRRYSPASPWADRFVLWVYWLFSGYGLRASRALVAFALVVPLFAIALWLWGLGPPPKAQPPIRSRCYAASRALPACFGPPHPGLTNSASYSTQSCG